ncbi:MAG: type III-B CRISPR module RAMP protein Cmr1 [Bacteroidota bacterium]
MKSITFTCETITPMFLSGADGQTPELRPPSIKGALRFWWRAMQGELPKKEKDRQWVYHNLKNIEQNSFGGTGGFEINKEKTTALRSKFNIRIANAKTTIRSTKNEFVNKSGLEYFFYLIVNEMQDYDEGFIAPTKFDVIISAREEKELLNASACFWLLTYLGGLVSRVRRGAGSFEITQIRDRHNILNNKLSMMPEDSSKDFIQEGLKQVSNIITKKEKGGICDQYSTLQSKHIYISKRHKKNWKDILHNIGIMMKDVRKGQTHRIKEERTFTQDTLDQKAAFGLPMIVIFQFYN